MVIIIASFLALPLIEAFRFDLLRSDIDGMGLVFPSNRGTGTPPPQHKLTGLVLVG